MLRRVDNGLMSRFLVNKAPLGQIIEAHHPKGKFLLEPDAACAVFVAGGTGLGPIRPLMHQALLLKQEVHLLYAAYNAAEAPYYYECKALAAANPAFHFHFYQSTFPNPHRLSASAFERFLNNITESRAVAHYYFCSPYTLMRSLKLVLGYQRIPVGQIHTEQFQAQALPATRPTQPFETCTAHVAATAGQAASFLVRRGEYVLNEALRHQIALPYSCKGGICGSCVARLSQGQVVMVRNEVLSEKELEADLFLTCTALPMSNEIFFHYE